MKRAVTGFLIGTALLALATGVALAEELTVHSILVAHRAGATASGIVALVNDPANSIVSSPGDVLALRAAGVPEAVIAAVEARGATSAAPPAAPIASRELAFDLVLVRPGLLKKNRAGRLVLRGDSLAWVDGGNADRNFDFRIAGLEKVWFTCQARSPENFCYQVNFRIVKGARYQFQDVNQEAGSNAAVLEVMEALRRYFPQIAFGAPDATKG